MSEGRSCATVLFSSRVHAGQRMCHPRAGTSAKGITKALTERPDLILTDLNLPDMNAIQAITILKNNSVTLGIPIVVLTAQNGGQWKAKALKAGAAEYLLKPISPGNLLQVVRRFCRPFPSRH